MSSLSSKRYQRQNETPLYWFNKASDLRATAGLVWLGIKSKEADKMAEKLGLGKGFDFGVACFKPYHMLCGLSLELALKAIIVARKKDVPSLHNLNHLVDLAEVDYKKEELELMTVLSHFIVWGGKYPTPKELVKMEDYDYLIGKLFFRVKKQIGSLEIKEQYRSFDWETFCGLWEKVSDTFSDLN